VEDCAEDHVRHEAREGERRWETCACRPSQRLVETGGSLIRETPVRVGAAPTTPGRAGTARRRGPGQQDGKVYARNQCADIDVPEPVPESGASAAADEADPTGTINPANMSTTRPATARRGRRTVVNQLGVANRPRRRRETSSHSRPPGTVPPTTSLRDGVGS
jgi:hypothetical protein